MSYSLTKSGSPEPVQPRPVPWRRWLLALLVGLVAVVAGGVLGAVLTQPRESSPGFAATGPLFESLEELTASSDLIVVGTVQEVQRPTVIEAEDAEFPTRRLNTVLSVETPLKGSPPAESLTVATLELAYRPPPGGSVPDWREEGRRVFAFLSASKEGATGNRGEPLFFPTSYPQSFYLVDGETLTAAYQEQDERLLSERIERREFDQLVTAVEGALADS